MYLSPALRRSQPFGATMLYFDSWNRPTEAAHQDLDFLLVLNSTDEFHNQPE